MSSLYRLVIIVMSVYFKQYRREGQPWRTPLLISDSLESLELNLIGIFVCVCPLLL